MVTENFSALYCKPIMERVESENRGELRAFERCIKLVLSGIVLFLIFPDRSLEAAQPVASGPPTFSPDSFLEGFSPQTLFLIKTLGFGGVAGLCVGYTLKKFAKLAALVLGVVFMAIQALAYNQFITVDWQKVNLVLPEASIQQAWTGFMSILTYNFPFAGAFLSGFYLGFRKG